MKRIYIKTLRDHLISHFVLDTQKIQDYLCFAGVSYEHNNADSIRPSHILR